MATIANPNPATANNRAMKIVLWVVAAVLLIWLVSSIANRSDRMDNSPALQERSMEGGTGTTAPNQGTDTYNQNTDTYNQGTGTTNQGTGTTNESTTTGQ